MYDVIVIGSGPGGYVAAIRCAQLGMKTALVEKYDTLGGTCLNVGCIPSKALLDSSEHFHNAAHTFDKHGIDLNDLKVNLDQMMKRKNEVISQTCDGVKFLMDKNKIDVINDEKLLLNYAEDKFIEKSLNMEPPFFLSVNANSELSMLIEQDTIDTYTELLYPGTEINLQGFISKAKIIFSNTDNIKARLNGEELSIIENYPHPLKLIIQSSPPSISIRLFTPLN